MIQHTFESQFRDIVSRFFQLEMSTDEFCSEITDLWIQQRDKSYEKKRDWTQPYDQQLIEGWSNSIFTDEEFQKKWAELWDTVGSDSLFEMLNSIHSACSIYNPQPEFKWELNDDEFRSEVYKIVTSFKLYY